jgi:hypothetical protein
MFTSQPQRSFSVAAECVNDDGEPVALGSPIDDWLVTCQARTQPLPVRTRIRGFVRAICFGVSVQAKINDPPDKRGSIPAHIVTQQIVTQQGAARFGRGILSDVQEFQANRLQ